ncbi:hypothetical protein [Streptomyces sp. NPDC016675]|uniref:hypothetical protein n=1 Tax=Streptomyces sp. NPDC016675 TaxID=3364970 RepID=UPI0036FC425A
MSWPAVLPGAAPRVMRAAAGRRALHVGLLVAGLFVLGVLCGERARATDEAPSVRDTVHQVIDVPQDQHGGRAESHTQAHTRTEAPTPTRRPRAGVQESGALAENADLVLPGLGPVTAGLRPLTEDVVRPVRERVLEPVGNAVEAVDGELGALVRAQVPPSAALPIPSLPTLPSAPTSPSTPSLPDSPSLPDLPSLPDPSHPSASPGLPELPEPTGPAGPVPPGGPAQEPSAPEPDASDDVSTSRDAGTSDEAGARASADGAAGVATAAHGPEQVGDGPSTAARVDTRRVQSAPAGQAPVRRAPTGDPDGTLGAGAGADHGAPRHGDAHAVTPHHRIPFRLVPGAVERADAAETRDRYRDIPVSPA